MGVTLAQPFPVEVVITPTLLWGGRERFEVWGALFLLVIMLCFHNDEGLEERLQEQ